jgi:ATP-dependent RNA helicase RhlE
LKTFETLNLIAPLQRALAGENYTTPTPIQAQTIPAALEQRDVLGCAQTGTGKTAAFALPILNRLAQQNRKALPKRPLALVLAPTRELAIQIGQSFTTYGQHLNLRHALVYGGVNQASQVNSMNRGSHILVATPGRLLDLMNQGHILLDQLEVFVLDEADRMLDMGFLPDLKRIIRALPTRRQSLFFSATMPPNIIDLAQRLLTDPISVNVTPKSQSVDKIEQRVVFVDRKGKQDMLAKILTGAGVERSIVFTKTKRAANMVAERLNRSGIKSVAIHGNKSQNARQRALDSFRNHFVQVLVATDVAARGIDIDGVTHVINFDLPMEPEAYVHRIGRTGRAGAAGIALSFCTDADRADLQAIERLIKKRIPVDAEYSEEPSNRRSHDDRSTETKGSRNPNRSSRSGPTSRRNEFAQPQGRGTRSSTNASKPRSRTQRSATSTTTVRTSTKESTQPRAVTPFGGECAPESPVPQRRRAPRRGKNERQRAGSAG